MTTVLRHQIPLRGGAVIAEADLPANLTTAEADRITGFVAALVVPADWPAPSRRRAGSEGRAQRVARAAELRRAGGTYRSIGEELGVSYQTVANYLAES